VDDLIKLNNVLRSRYLEFLQIGKEISIRPPINLDCKLKSSLLTLGIKDGEMLHGEDRLLLIEGIGLEGLRYFGHVR
jgi:hypothetical protein